jgi:hypothetical protein
LEGDLPHTSGRPFLSPYSPECVEGAFVCLEQHGRDDSNCWYAPYQFGNEGDTPSG